MQVCNSLWFSNRTQVKKCQLFFRRGLPLASILLVMGLGVGTCGYHVLEGRSWFDSFYGACMVFSTQGPVFSAKTSVGKMFVAVYGLISSLLLIGIVWMVIEPPLLRWLHKLQGYPRESDVEENAPMSSKHSSVDYQSCKIDSDILLFI
jgi:hypothetical protein